MTTTLEDAYTEILARIDDPEILDPDDDDDDDTDDDDDDDSPDNVDPEFQD